LRNPLDFSDSRVDPVEEFADETLVSLDPIRVAGRGVLRSYGAEDIAVHLRMAHEEAQVGIRNRQEPLAQPGRVGLHVFGGMRKFCRDR